MTLRLRALIAGAAVMTMAVSVWTYLMWPCWYGTNVVLPVVFQNDNFGNGQLYLVYPDAKLKIESPNTNPQANYHAGGFAPIRSVGVVWDPHRDPLEVATAMRHRTLFLQLKQTEKLAANGDQIWHPVSVSATPITGVVNLRVRVAAANSAGEFEVEIARDHIPMSSAPTVKDGAIWFKVLPSGRAALIAPIH